MIAGTGSGCGKTTAVCGILYGLKQMGLRVAAWKCGPDYIDPMFHQKVIGIPTGNLDLFFSGENTVRELLTYGMEHADIGIVEGAMGYYDGIGMTQEASPYALAQAGSMPVVLVVNARGMGSSLFALLQGFVQYRNPSRIVGVLLNQVTEKRYLTLKKTLEEMGLQAVGYIPPQREFLLESRHLGLITADEVTKFHEKLKKFYQFIKNTIDWQALLRIAGEAQPLRCSQRMETALSCPFALEHGKAAPRPITLGVARDEAFCFIYEDNLRYLERAGCRLVFFSPLRDQTLPEDLDGLLLYGGYPELYASQLSENIEMRRAVKEAVTGGMPCIAECGGFLYLQKTLTDQNGKIYEMAGVLSGNSFFGRTLERFGYIQLSLCRGEMFGRSDMTLRAHEFHYYQCDRTGDAFHAKKASGEAQWMTGIVNEALYAAFPHIYFYGNEPFAEAFLEKAAAYRKQKGK